MRMLFGIIVTVLVISCVAVSSQERQYSKAPEIRDIRDVEDRKREEDFYRSYRSEADIEKLLNQPRLVRATNPPKENPDWFSIEFTYEITKDNFREEADRIQATYGGKITDYIAGPTVFGILIKTDLIRAENISKDLKVRRVFENSGMRGSLLLSTPRPIDPTKKSKQKK